MPNNTFNFSRSPSLLGRLFKLVGFNKICGLLLICLACCSSVQAKPQVLDTEYFDVELTHGWTVQGVPQNSLRALNVNFKNDVRKTRINIVIGAAQNSIDDQLNQMRDSFRSNGARVSQIRALRDMKYFTFVLGDWPGFCYVGSNGKDMAIITAIGNRSEAARFIRSFYNRNEDLFPSF